MMRFLFGVAIGAGGYWAYKQGLMPFSPKEVLDQFMPGNSPTSFGNSSNGGGEIIRPTAHEVMARPSEPMPS